jgi:ADP-ribosyl-[dinitrogen reductase] hydrolase
VEALESALWCFDQTSSFEEAVLRAANLGDDADTTAAICGQLSGAYYGVNAIPEQWRERLTMCDDIMHLALQLYELREPQPVI